MKRGIFPGKEIFFWFYKKFLQGRSSVEVGLIGCAVASMVIGWSQSPLAVDKKWFFFASCFFAASLVWSLVSKLFTLCWQKIANTYPKTAEGIIFLGIIGGWSVKALVSNTYPLPLRLWAVFLYLCCYGLPSVIYLLGEENLWLIGLITVVVQIVFTLTGLILALRPYKGQLKLPLRRRT